MLRNASSSAVLRLSPGRPSQGVLVDAMTGRAITAEECDGRGDMCIDLPAGFRLLLLAMRYRAE